MCLLGRHLRRLQSLSIKSIKALAPLLDRVLVQRVKVAEVCSYITFHLVFPPRLTLSRLRFPPHLQKTASGLFLPSAAAGPPPPEGLVLAVGPGAPGRNGELIAPSVKEGDRVVLPGFGGLPVKVGEEVSCCSPATGRVA